MPIMVAVKIVRLKVYMTIAILMILTFIEDHKCVSKCNISEDMYCITFKLGMVADVCMPYMLMLVSMTMTVMQGHSVSAKANKSALHALGN